MIQQSTMLLPERQSTNIRHGWSQILSSSTLSDVWINGFVNAPEIGAVYKTGSYNLNY